MIKRLRKCIAFKVLKTSRRNSGKLLHESEILRQQAFESRLKAESIRHSLQTPDLIAEKDLSRLLSGYLASALNDAGEFERKSQKTREKALRKRRISARISRIVSGKRKAG
jgi:hypothetical protein